MFFPFANVTVEGVDHQQVMVNLDKCIAIYDYSIDENYGISFEHSDGTTTLYFKNEEDRNRALGTLVMCTGLATLANNKNQRNSLFPEASAKKPSKKKTAKKPLVIKGTAKKVAKKKAVKKVAK